MEGDSLSGKTVYEQSKMEDQLMEMVTTPNLMCDLYESIMCVYFDMEEDHQAGRLFAGRLMTRNGY